MRTGILTGIIVFFLASCGNKNKIPAGVFKPDKMEAVLWDIIRVESFTRDFVKKDTLKIADEEYVKLQKAVFARHQVTKADFDKSYNYYKTKTDLFKTVLDSMITRANRDRFIKPIQIN